MTKTGAHPVFNHIAIGKQLLERRLARRDGSDIRGGRGGTFRSPCPLVTPSRRNFFLPIPFILVSTVSASSLNIVTEFSEAWLLP